MKRSRWLVGSLLAVVALSVIAVLLFTRERAPEVVARADPPPAAPAPAPRATPVPSPPPAMPDPPFAPPPDERTHPVDLERLRAELPDNLYWTDSAPTDDPDVLRQRAENDQRWNSLYGKTLSGDATEEEIHRYFDHRKRVSEDAIQFATRVLQEFGDQLPDEELGLYQLSVKMHRTRLDELPRQIDEALARKAEQDKRREEWKRTGR